METRSATRRGVLIDVALFCVAALSVWPVLLAADLYVHNRHDAGGTLNVRGYKGPVLGAKRPGEIRVEVLGSSRVYGYQLPAEDAIPAQLEQPLATALARPVSVANLGGAGESSACYADTLHDFDYLEPDAVVLYTGDADLPEGVAERDPGAPDPTTRDPNTCVRRRSPIFPAIGYMPVMADILRERYFLLRYGDLDVGYRENYSVARQYVASGVGAVPGAPNSATSRSGPPPGPSVEPRIDPTTAFVTRIRDIVVAQLARGRVVVVVGQPTASAAFRAQQTALRAALEPEIRTPRFAFVDLVNAIDLNDPALSFDGRHVTREGARRVAAALAPPLAAVIHSVTNVRP